MVFTLHGVNSRRGNCLVLSLAGYSPENLLAYLLTLLNLSLIYDIGRVQWDFSHNNTKTVVLTLRASQRGWLLGS